MKNPRKAMLLGTGIAIGLVISQGLEDSAAASSGLSIETGGAEKEVVRGIVADPIPASQEPSSEEDIRRALAGGVPMGRWREGLLFEGLAPHPWLKSAANWFPRTEDIQPHEMRIIFMGTAPFIRPGQMNTSIFVQLGNGENFVFDIGEGSDRQLHRRRLCAE